MLGYSCAFADSATPQGLANELTSSFRTVANIVSDVSIVIGALMFMGGLFHLKRYGEMRRRVAVAFIDESSASFCQIAPAHCGDGRCGGSCFDRVFNFQREQF